MAKKILITGAAGGFGKLTVQQLLKDGHQVVGTVRNLEKEANNDLRSAGAQLIKMDVTNDERVIEGVNQAISLLGGLDVVINNAGVGVVGMQEHFTPEDLMQLFDVNVIGVQRVNRAALPYLRKQGSGILVHISSLLGRMTLPFYGPYNASKWALEALAENYRSELSVFGIASCIVEPGGYPTTFMTNLMQPSDTTRNESYGDFFHAPKAMFDGFEQALANNPEQNPQKVADAIAQVVGQTDSDRPFRTVVDSMGMGDHIKGYNDQLDQITNGIYSVFGMEGMLEVKA
ncbi:MAG: SDR family oxidoreductase [Cytophagales bacterium]|nr:SDR family oxidoreductase [Cytophagales bacterium]